MSAPALASIAWSLSSVARSRLERGLESAVVKREQDVAGLDDLPVPHLLRHDLAGNAGTDIDHRRRGNEAHGVAADRKVCLGGNRRQHRDRTIATRVVRRRRWPGSGRMVGDELPDGANRSRREIERRSGQRGRSKDRKKENSAHRRKISRAGALAAIRHSAFLRPPPHLPDTEIGWLAGRRDQQNVSLPRFNGRRPMSARTAAQRGGLSGAAGSSEWPRGRAPPIRSRERFVLRSIKQVIRLSSVDAGSDSGRQRLHRLGSLPRAVRCRTCGVGTGARAGRGSKADAAGQMATARPQDDAGRRCVDAACGFRRGGELRRRAVCRTAPAMMSPPFSRLRCWRCMRPLPIARIGLMVQISARVEGADRDRPSWPASAAPMKPSQAKSGIPFVILRPAVVIRRNAYGGYCACSRPCSHSLANPAPSSAITDAIRSAGRCHRGGQGCDQLDRIVAGQRSGARLAGNGLTLDEAVALHQAWLGLPRAPTIAMPDLVARLLSSSPTSSAGSAGARRCARRRWRSLPAASSMRRHPRCTNAGKPLKSLQDALSAEPASVQDVWFARLYLLKPAMIAVLSLFWLASGDSRGCCASSSRRRIWRRRSVLARPQWR